jgi:hypothetical protein
MSNNARIPLFRLPVELLVKILRECSWRDLLAINSVCKTIKHLTDAAHVLWATVPLAYEGVPDKLAELFIRRSGSVPISFAVYNIVEYSTHQLDVIASQLHRTKALHASTTEGTDLNNFMKILHSTRTDYMEDLSLRQSIGMSTRLEIGSTLCGGDLPRLDILSLDDVQIQGFPSAPLLKKLKLDETHCNIEVLKSGLMAFTQLQRLTISSLCLEHGSNYTPGEALVFPHLEKLRLDIDVSCLAILLNLLPDPFDTFELRVTQVDEATAPSLDNGDVKKALSRLTKFWTERTSLTKIASSSWFYAGGQFDSHKIYILRQDQHPPSHAHDLLPLAEVQVVDLLYASPYLSQVKDLLVGLDISEDFDIHIHHDVKLDHFTGVETLILEDTSDHIMANLKSWDTISTLQELDTFVEARKNSGASLASVIFRECSANFWSFFEHLRDSQAAHRVVWLGRFWEQSGDDESGDRHFESGSEESY